VAVERKVLFRACACAGARFFERMGKAVGLITTDFRQKRRLGTDHCRAAVAVIEDIAFSEGGVWLRLVDLAGDGGRRQEE
jgi:hypothetical protein